jgi:TM2 domain-containing membrane protein YozV
MKKVPTLFVGLGIAAASLSSCSRSNYAFNTTSPAYLGSEKVKAVASIAEPQAEAVATEAANALPAQQQQLTPAAKAIAKHSVKTAAAPAAPAATEEPVMNALTSTIAKTSYTHAERKAVRHQVKHIIASHNSTTAEGKSQLVAVLLCFFLGGLGIHDFYMGKVGKGILQIFLSLILVGFILVIIDFVRLLTGSLKPKDGDWAKKL